MNDLCGTSNVERNAVLFDDNIYGSAFTFLFDALLFRSFVGYFYHTRQNRQEVERDFVWLKSNNR
jgi:hypothetical protein